MNDFVFDFLWTTLKLALDFNRHTEMKVDPSVNGDYYRKVDNKRYESTQ